MHYCQSRRKRVLDGRETGQGYLQMSIMVVGAIATLVVLVLALGGGRYARQWIIAMLVFVLLAVVVASWFFITRPA
jgi:hypothetical protein